MKTLTLLFFALALSLPADSPDLKRNQKVQRLSAHAKQAQDALTTELRNWTADCEAKGMQLGQTGANLIDCMQKQTPAAPPHTAPVKPEAKPEAAK